MSLVTINLSRGAVQTLQMKLELDANWAAEQSVLSRLQSGVSFESDVANAFIKMLRAGDVVADVGANIGYLTVLAALLVGPSGRVVAFEPDAANVERLRGNLALNNCANVTVVEKAITNRVGEVEFFINSDNSGGNALWDVALFPGNVKSLAEPKRIVVEATTLDAEWKRLGLPAPRVIKIDTEGAEQLVLEGARDVLAGLQTKFAIAELHSFGLERLGCSQESLRAAAEQLGYSTFGLLYSGALPRFFPPATRIDNQHAINLLFSRPEWMGEIWPAAAFDAADSR
jgi:FkbM family methyltransferase